MAKQKVEQTEMTSAAEIEALDTLLEDLEINEEVEAAGDEEVVLEDLALDGELDEDALRDLNAEIVKEEIYAEQASEVGDVSTEKPAKKAKSFKKSRATGSTPVTRTPRDLASIAPEVFVLEGDVDAMSDDEKEAAKKATMLLTPKQKKIAEKFENLFTALAAGKKPSTYIVQAFKLLDQNGSMGMSDLIALYKTPGSKSDTEGYNHGTAASQAGQIFTLFDAVKIATRTKSTLTLNKGSVVAERLRAVIA